MKNKVTITNDSGENIPDSFLNHINDIKSYSLGNDYELSLVFTNADKIRELNQNYRNKNTPTDILSFTLSQNEGEIFICIEEAKKEAKKFDREYENFLLFLFIHGCVHLKGFNHSSKMEDVEKEIRNKFKV